METREVMARAARAIDEAQALVVLTGAGMGVDSGLPDFRGQDGMYAWGELAQRLGMSMMQLASPMQMLQTPRLCWGVLAYQWSRMQAATPHAGFEVLRRWAEDRPSFAFTSNVDRLLQRAGFAEDAIVECHGSMAHLQSMRPASDEDPVWPLGDREFEWDARTFELIGELPRSEYDGELARPNALMFMDAAWVPSRTWAQRERMNAWLEEHGAQRVALIECGAGHMIPTVRHQAHELLEKLDHATLVRINPQQLYSPDGTVHIELGAAQALAEIDRLL